MHVGQRPPKGTTVDATTNGRGDGRGEMAFSGGESLQHVDTDDWEAIYVVGDVHGCIDELRTLFDRLSLSEDDLIIFVGDLVRKGPDSAAVVDLIRSRPNTMSVRGNNEEKLLRGTAECGVEAGHLAYLMSMPICLSVDESLVVHAGIDPRRSVETQSTKTLLTIRSIPPENGYAGPFWFESHEGPPRVFFGHTVLDEPLVTDQAVGLDTGCVYGGSLTAYDWEQRELISVPAEREYQSRADTKIVESG